MSWIIFQMLCRFWIFLCIFMFLPSNFNVFYSLTNIWLLTRRKSHMMDSYFSIWKIKLFHETFQKFLTFWTVWYIQEYNILWKIKELRGNDVVVSSFWLFLKVINNTIDKSIWIVSIKELLCNFRYLICRKVVCACCSIQIV